MAFLYPPPPLYKIHLYTWPEHQLLLLLVVLLHLSLHLRGCNIVTRKNGIKLSLILLTFFGLFIALRRPFRLSFKNSIDDFFTYIGLIYAMCLIQRIYFRPLILGRIGYIQMALRAIMPIKDAGDVVVDPFMGFYKAPVDVTATPQLLLNIRSLSTLLQDDPHCKHLVCTIGTNGVWSVEWVWGSGKGFGGILEKDDTIEFDI